jgi:hypothetical protein
MKRKKWEDRVNDLSKAQLRFFPWLPLIFAGLWAGYAITLLLAHGSPVAMLSGVVNALAVLVLATVWLYGRLVRGKLPDAAKAATPGRGYGGPRARLYLSLALIEMILAAGLAADCVVGRFVTHAPAGQCAGDLALGIVCLLAAACLYSLS